MQTRIWPMLADKIHANTIITGMSWSWVEPEEGKYDFSIADAAIENAKQHNMRIVWMWFASWTPPIASSWSRWKTKWAWAATRATGLRWRMQPSPSPCPHN